jgi:tRNA pseudouridine55 synthase
MSELNGILIIDKPEGITSHDVVSRVRRILKTKRVGHTGTLDPFATGVMVILVGQATRLAQFIDKDEKEYEAVLRFGYETDTGDKTGVGTAEPTVTGSEMNSVLAAVDWNSVFDVFRGGITQIPPMFSAKKVDGKKLYEHARKGEVIERKPIAVTIHALENLGSEFSDLRSEIKIRVVCAAGTYIRTLAEDIGRKIGAFAHLTELRRTRSGKFAVDESVTLKQLQDLEEPASILIPMSQAVSHLPEILLPDERLGRTRNGLSTRVDEGKFNDGDAIRMRSESGELIAIGHYNAGANSVEPKIVLL